jgi:hypothetical protein
MPFLGVLQAAQAAVTEDLPGPVRASGAPRMPGRAYGPLAVPITVTYLAMGPHRSRAALNGGKGVDDENRVSSPRDSPGKLP